VDGAAAIASALHHLSYRKRPQIAVVAVARELVGLLWAVMQDVTPTEQLVA
jgi:Mg-chelatase subunit ChlD